MFSYKHHCINELQSPVPVLSPLYVQKYPNLTSGTGERVQATSDMSTISDTLLLE